MFTLFRAQIKPDQPHLPARKATSVFVFRPQGALMLPPSFGGATKKTHSGPACVYFSSHHTLTNLQGKYSNMNAWMLYVREDRRGQTWK